MRIVSLLGRKGDKWESISCGGDVDAIKKELKAMKQDKASCKYDEVRYYERPSKSARFNKKAVEKKEIKKKK